MELSTPVIIGIVVVVLIILIILIALGVMSSKRRKARQQEADRQRAAQLRDEAKSHETAVQERDLEVRETELEADRARLEAEQKSKQAEQEQIAAERRRAEAEKQRVAAEQQRAEVEHERGSVQERLAEADRLDPDSPDDAPRREEHGAPLTADSRREHGHDARGAAHSSLEDDRGRTADDDALADDTAARPAGHGRRAARSMDEEPTADGFAERTPDDHAPGAAEDEDAHPGTAPRAGTAAGIGAGEHHGGYLNSTGTVDGAPQQTPPADQQFGPPSEPGGRQTPPADQQFGRPVRHDAPHSEQEQVHRQEPREAPFGEDDDRAGEQDPFFRQQHELREQDGELPPQEPELDDPQDGSHRG